MCVLPKPNTPAAAPVDDATPAASSLALGSVPRGAAGLGRLALRLGGKALGGTKATAAASSTPSPVAPSAPSSTASQSLAFQDTSSSGDVPQVGRSGKFKYSPNDSLAIGE